MKILKVIYFIFCIVMSNALQAIIVGSDTTVSRQSSIFFPAADTDNQVNGFAFLDQGFRLGSNTTTATWNCFYPVAGRIGLGGGIFFLTQDFVFDNNAVLFVGGKFFGGGRSIEFAESLGTNNFVDPTGCGFMIPNASSVSLTKPINALDWSYSGDYLAAVTQKAVGVNPELQLYYFDGLTLTATSNGSVDIGDGNGNECRWHPTENYLAVARNATAGQEIQIYFHNVTNGSFTLTGSMNTASDVYPLAWHPSGAYLVAGTRSTTKELILYSFSNGVITEKQSINVSGNPSFTSGTVSWGPGGSYLAVGSNVVPEIAIYSFNGATLSTTPTVSATVGFTVFALDYSKSGTYIAIGTSSSGQRLQIFKHNVSNGTLTNLVIVGVQTSSQINSVQWNAFGNCLLVGTNAGANSVIQNYTWDPTSLGFTRVDEQPSTVSINQVRRSCDNRYVAYGNTTPRLQVFATGVSSTSLINESPYIFRNTSIIFNSDYRFAIKCFFEGSCKINARGAHLALDSPGFFTVSPGGNLVIQDAVLSGLTSSNFACQADNGSITLQNCSLFLSDAYSFSKGALLINNDVTISGMNKFSYTAARTSTIASGAKLTFDQGTTFSYAPRVAKNNLIFMTDETSELYLNGCTLSSTLTGLCLTNGMLTFDNRVTLSSQARNTGEALELTPAVQISVLGDAFIDAYGIIKYG